MAPIIMVRTTVQYSNAEIEDVRIRSAIFARKKIIQYNQEKDLQEDATTDAFGRPNMGVRYRRGLYYRMKTLFKTEQLIADALDPTWMLLPQPEELQDSFGYMELSGHLSLLMYCFECYKPVFSSDEDSMSDFMLFQFPFAHKDNISQANSVGDMKHFKTLSHFTISPTIHLDNGPARHRLALFTSPERNWVGRQGQGILDPVHAWVGWVGIVKGKERFLIIYDPNHTVPIAPLPNQKYKSTLIFPMRHFIERCIDTWSGLSKRRLYIVGHGTGNDKGLCLQHCSRWLQGVLIDEGWRQFPWSEEYIMERHGTPIIWSKAGLRSIARSAPRNTPTTARVTTRSRSSSPAAASTPARKPLKRTAKPISQRSGMRFGEVILADNGGGSSTIPAPPVPTTAPTPEWHTPPPAPQYSPTTHDTLSPPDVTRPAPTPPRDIIPMEPESGNEDPILTLPLSKRHCRAAVQGEPSVPWDAVTMWVPEGYHQMFSSKGGPSYFVDPAGNKVDITAVPIWDEPLVYDLSRHRVDAAFDLEDDDIDDDINDDLLLTYQMLPALRP
ncbi:hypothetical protein VTL71DRAFT_4996 [Oculimacula yallundae]|uniref:Uncharacterized protein n=1 Tax=Oculimacula yallundae TaxID=86028 RepID=A0ABR4C4R2_9HELO